MSSFSDFDLAKPYFVQGDERGDAFCAAVQSRFSTKEEAVAFFGGLTTRCKWIGQLGSYTRSDVGTVNDLIWFDWNTNEYWPDESEDGFGYPDQDIFNWTAYTPAAV